MYWGFSNYFYFFSFPYSTSRRALCSGPSMAKCPKRQRARNAGYGGILHGARRGEFEERLKSVLREIAQSEAPSMSFTRWRKRDSSGNMLKPAWRMAGRTVCGYRVGRIPQGASRWTRCWRGAKPRLYLDSLSKRFSTVAAQRCLIARSRGERREKEQLVTSLGECHEPK